MATERDALLTRLLLKAEAEDFLAHEADLLDARRFRDWLALLTEDVTVWMPMTRNVKSGGDAAERTREGSDINWIDEGMETLRQRVTQLETGIHWAEQPPSRTTHMVSNVLVVDAEGELDSGPENVTGLDLRCRFMVYRNRNEDEEDFFIGKRSDRLRRVDGAWRLARREVYLDQNVLLAKNLPVFL
jgi:3-phenylpropionate/cinnamic acid dioxygenase small subunit